MGRCDRTDYDLNQHIKTSGKSLDYFDPETNGRYVPYVIEPSLGVERLFLTVVCEAYDEENIGTEEKPDVRTVMRFHPALAPFKACNSSAFQEAQRAGRRALCRAFKALPC